MSLLRMSSQKYVRRSAQHKEVTINSTQIDEDACCGGHSPAKNSYFAVPSRRAAGESKSQQRSQSLRISQLEQLEHYKHQVSERHSRQLLQEKQNYQDKLKQQKDLITAKKKLELECSKEEIQTSMKQEFAKQQRQREIDLNTEYLQKEQELVRLFETEKLKIERECQTRISEIEEGVEGRMREQANHLEKRRVELVAETDQSIQNVRQHERELRDQLEKQLADGREREEASRKAREEMETRDRARIEQTVKDVKDQMTKEKEALKETLQKTEKRMYEERAKDRENHYKTKRLLNDAENKYLIAEQKVKTSEDQIDNLKTQTKSLYVELAALEQSNQLLEKDLSKMRRLELETISLREEKREIQQNQTLLQQKIDQLSTRNDSLKQQNSESDVLLSRLTEEVRNLDSQFQKTRAESDQFRKDNTELLAQIDCLQFEQNQLQSKYEQANDLLKIESDCKKELESENLQTRDQMNTIIQQVEVESGNLRQQLQDEQMRINEYVSQLEQSYQQITSLQKDNLSLKDQLESQSEVACKLRKQILDLEQQKRQLNNEMHQTINNVTKNNYLRDRSYQNVNKSVDQSFTKSENVKQQQNISNNNCHLRMRNGQENKTNEDENRISPKQHHQQQTRGRIGSPLSTLSTCRYNAQNMQDKLQQQYPLRTNSNCNFKAQDQAATNITNLLRKSSPVNQQSDNAYNSFRQDQSTINHHPTERHETTLQHHNQIVTNQNNTVTSPLRTMSPNQAYDRNQARVTSGLPETSKNTNDNINLVRMAVGPPPAPYQQQVTEQCYSQLQQQASQLLRELEYKRKKIQNQIASPLNSGQSVGTQKQQHLPTEDFRQPAHQPETVYGNQTSPLRQASQQTQKYGAKNGRENTTSPLRHQSQGRANSPRKFDLRLKSIITRSNSNQSLLQAK